MDPVGTSTLIWDFWLAGGSLAHCTTTMVPTLAVNRDLLGSRAYCLLT